MKILLIVDLQNDYIKDKNAKKKAKELSKYIKNNSYDHYFIIMDSRDNNFCISGTYGWDVPKYIDSLFAVTRKREYNYLFHNSENGEKTIFDSLDGNLLVEFINKHKPEIDVCGMLPSVIYTTDKVISYVLKKFLI